MLTQSIENQQYGNIIADLADSLKKYEQIKESLMAQLDFKLFSPAAAWPERPIQFAAVDSSSSTVVDAGCFIIIAHSSGFVITKNDQLEPDLGTSNPSVDLALIDTSKNAVERNYQKFLTPLMEVIGTADESKMENITIKQPHPRDVDWLQLTRSMEEWQQIRQLIDRLKPGDFILRDGALRSDIRLPSGLVNNILKYAGDKGIHVIGLVKRSTIPIKTGQLMPIVPAVQQLGAMEFSNSPWYTPIPSDQNDPDSDPYHFGTSYIVQYHPLSQFAFWTDLNKYDTINPAEAFSKISGLCNDPVYIGYPYPLALVHNHVVLTHSKIEDIKYDLQGNAIQSDAITGKNWDMLFKDFHEILDINIY